MANNYVDLGQACGDVCRALHRGLEERQLDRLYHAILDAIGDLTW
jgi:hypothetical protein